MSKCVYAGSFDPITCGHIDIIERIVARFGSVIVVVPINKHKEFTFSLKQRLDFIIKSTAHISGVTTDSIDGLLVNYMKSINADLIIKGLRTQADFEHEYQMASVNARLSKDIDTVFMMADPKYSFISSTVVRELILHDGDVRGLVPGSIIGDIKKHIGR